MNSSFIDDGIKRDQAIRDAVVSCKSSAEILWHRISGTEWTAEEAKKQNDQATSWFRKYCIGLTFREFKLDETLQKKTKYSLKALSEQYNNIVKNIPKALIAKEADLNEAQTLVVTIYEHIVVLEDLARKEEEKATHKKSDKPAPKDIFTVLFLDEWYNNTSEGGSGVRPFRVTANHQTFYMIGVTRYDRESRNMLTHELTHALRRQGHNDNKKCFDEFVKKNAVTDKSARGWEEHYSGTVDANRRAMTHPTRTNGLTGENDLDDDRVLSVREYLTIVAAGYVGSEPGCDDQHNEPGVGTDR